MINIKKRNWYVAFAIALDFNNWITREYWVKAFNPANAHSEAMMKLLTEYNYDQSIVYKIMRSECFCYSEET